MEVIIGISGFYKQICVKAALTVLQNEGIEEGDLLYRVFIGELDRWVHGVQVLHKFCIFLFSVVPHDNNIINIPAPQPRL